MTQAWRDTHLFPMPTPKMVALLPAPGPQAQDGHTHHLEGAGSSTSHQLTARQCGGLTARSSHIPPPWCPAWQAASKPPSLPAALGHPR